MPRSLQVMIAVVLIGGGASARGADTTSMVADQTTTQVRLEIHTTDTKVLPHQVFVLHVTVVNATDAPVYFADLGYASPRLLVSVAGQEFELLDRVGGLSPDPISPLLLGAGASAKISFPVFPWVFPSFPPAPEEGMEGGSSLALRAAERMRGYVATPSGWERRELRCESNTMEITIVSPQGDAAQALAVLRQWHEYEYPALKREKLTGDAFEAKVTAFYESFLGRFSRTPYAPQVRRELMDWFEAPYWQGRTTGEGTSQSAIQATIRDLCTDGAAWAASIEPHLIEVLAKREAWRSVVSLLQSFERYAQDESTVDILLLKMLESTGECHVLQARGLLPVCPESTALDATLASCFVTVSRWEGLRAVALPPQAYDVIRRNRGEDEAVRAARNSLAAISRLESMQGLPQWEYRRSDDKRDAARGVIEKANQ